MKKESDQSWIEALTSIVTDIEQFDEFHRERISHLAMTFFDMAVQICQLIQDVNDGEHEEDDQGLVALLMQRGHNLNSNLGSLDRGTEPPKEEICFEMYRFISLLSQRMNFEAR